MVDPFDQAVILLYHGVTASAPVGVENFSRKHMPREEFERQISYVARRCAPMTLREMAGLLARRAPLPRGAVAVTFDDTFRNVADVALPILKRHGVPATFFITTGFIGTNRRFWVDVVEHCVNRTTRTELALSLGGRAETFALRSPEDRVAAIVAVKRVLKASPPAVRDAALRELAEKAGVDNGDDVDNYRNLDWEGVRRLHAPPHYEVGGHTVNHEILAYLDPARLELEVTGCLDDLRRGLPGSVDLFSYPEGQVAHFNDEVIAKLKSAGVTVCPTAIKGFNAPGADPFHLRRCMVGFMGEAFPYPLEAA